MTVEFLGEGAEACPLIRLFDLSQRELELIYDGIGKLADKDSRLFFIGSHPTGAAQPPLRINLIPSSNDVGVYRATDAADWTWELTPESWGTVASLIEPFVSDPREGAFQWLTGPMARHGLDVGETSVLLSASRDGRW